MNDSSRDDLGPLADLVLARLLQHPAMRQRLDGGPLPFGPVGEPVPGLPQLPGREPFPDLYPRTRLAIDGIELTQSIQHYGTGYGEDNSVPIVALKPLAVRVYAVVRRALFGPDALSGQRVTGTLVLSRWGQEVFRTGPTRASGARLGTAELMRRDLWDTEISGGASVGGGGGVTVGALRFQRNGPLNFLVPAWYLRRGRLTATVLLHTETGESTSRDIDFDVIDVPAPKVALVRVNWTSAANVTSSPTDASMLGTVRLAERMLPFPYFATTILTTELDETGDFGMTVPAGGCNAQWDDLLTSLRQLRFWVQLFQLADIVYGVVPSQANLQPAGAPVNSGCGDADNGVGACFEGLGRSFAHEIGHIYGRKHVAVPGDDDNDPDYPAYGSDPRAIGEVGVDLGDRPVAVYAPPGSNDIMAYFDGNSPDAEKWISPYTYRALINERFRHASATPHAARFRPFLVMSFRIFRLASGGAGFELDTMHRVSAPGVAVPRPGGGGRHSVAIDLVDGHDRILATQHAAAIHTRGACGGCAGCGDGSREPGTTEHAEAIAWPEGGVARVRVRRGDDVVAEWVVGDPPRVDLQARCLDDGSVEVTVQTQHARASVATVLLFSHDDGDTWEPVALRVPCDGRLAFAAGRLQGGPRCRFRAVATAELQGAEATTEPFELPERGRALHVEIHAPRCDDESTMLRAYLDARGLGPCAAREVHWRSDLDGDLGQGWDLAVALSPGTHCVTARAPDGRGGYVTATGTVQVAQRRGG